MARRTTSQRASPRIFIAHRGGAASLDAGNFAGFFAAVPGGPADIGFTVVNGVVQPPVPPVNRDLEPFDYAVGAFGLGNAGFGWNGAAVVTTPRIGRAGVETFATYAVGAVTELNGGTGWAGSGLIAVH